MKNQKYTGLPEKVYRFFLGIPCCILPTADCLLPLLLRPQPVIQLQLINDLINYPDGGPELLQPAEIIHPEYRRFKKFFLHRDGYVNVGMYKGY